MRRRIQGRRTSLRHLAAVAIAGALYLAGCLGEIGGSDNGPTLEPEAEAGVTPLMKLSTVQYKNTVADLLTMSGLADLVEEVRPLLDSIPNDSSDTFRGLDNRIATEHFQGYFNVAAAIGDAVEEDPARLQALAGDCALEAALSDGCARDLLATFGRRVYRRALNDEELAFYLAFNDGTRGPAEAVRAMVLTLMLSPRFLNHLELEGAAFRDRGDIFQLTGYEVASKLSYTFWQSMPDDALLAAAEDGSLDTEAGYAAAVERVFSDPRTKDTLWQFYNEWFRLERFTGFAATRPAFQTLAEGENVGEPGHDHYGDMVREIRELVEMVTWQQGGTLTDLLTTNASVTTSADLARLYGVEPYSGSGDPPALPDGERVGILQRAALLVSSLEQTNPFHRGAFVRRYILCDSLPAPDPNSLPPGSLDPPPPDIDATTRERFEQKIEGNGLCESCHGSFASIGYVLEAYDALGRYRETEMVLDEQTGEIVNELPIDDVAPAEIVYGDKAPVDGPAELNERIVASGKVASCLSTQLFTYALRREPSSASGDRALKSELSSSELTLAAVYQAVALHPSFRVRKVGAP
jgi:hypothetical protein